MNFVNPNFLWALFAIAIPIIIHLINLRRYKIVYFSNTIFLKNLKKQKQTRNRLKNILILISRILMITMLVIAFACPYIPNNDNQKEKILLTAIYIDNSYSMQSDSKSGRNFEQAKNIAKQIIIQNPENMQYILITNSYLPEYQRILDKNTIINYIDAIEINPQILSISDIILKVQSLIQKNQNTNLFIISDMQKTIFKNEKINIPTNISVQLLSIPFVENNNIYIDSCYFENPIHRFNQKELLKIKIVNNTNDAIIDFPIQLYINDSLKAMTNCNLQAKEEKTIDMEFINTNEGEQKCRISISDFPITYDNDLYFAYDVVKTFRVLVINSSSENYYLNTLFETNLEEIQYTNVPINSAQTSTFSNYDMIILNNIESLTSGLSLELQNYVNTGASLVIIPNEKIDRAKLNELLSYFSTTSFSTDMLPDSKIKNIDYQIDMFKDVFVKQEKQLQLPIIKNIHKINNFNNSSMVAAISEESNNPLLLIGNIKSGKLYLFAFPFNDNNREFLSSSLFVASFLNIIFNIDISSKLYFNINNAQAYVNNRKQIDNYEAFKISNNNNIDSYLDFVTDGKKISFNLPSDISINGFYDIINVNYDTVSLLALNYDRNESKLSFFEINELKKYNDEYLFGKANIINIKSSLNIDLQIKSISEGEQIWIYFIFIAIFFIIMEILFIKFL